MTFSWTEPRSHLSRSAVAIRSGLIHTEICACERGFLSNTRSPPPLEGASTATFQPLKLISTPVELWRYRPFLLDPIGDEKPGAVEPCRRFPRSWAIITLTISL